MNASGILRVRTAFLPVIARDESRRKLWRPPAWLSLPLLGFGLIAGGGAIAHRRALDVRLAEHLRQTDSAPFEIKRIRQDLSEQETDEKTLSAELDTRLKYARSQKARDFYMVLDTRRGRFAFQYGDKIVRDGSLDIGAARTIRNPAGGQWSFAPVTGAFSVREKLEDPDWPVPAWVYAMNGLRPPRPLPVVPGGLGRYVIVFSDGYVIHSRPPRESPLQAAKPGSFMLSETDLSAIWRRVEPGMRIYIF